MGLKCSFLGHSFEDAGVERDREEQGSEVVTVVKELEQCRRCGEERVVSESTEVTTVVDPDEVDADIDDGAAAGGTGGFGGAVDRAMDEGGDHDGAETLEEGPEPAEDAAAEAAASEAAAAVDELAEEPDEAFEARDPEEEDAEILTDDDAERDPGEWPDDHEGADDGRGADTLDDAPDVPGSDAGTPVADAEDRAELGDSADEDSLSGITVPEGRIVCPECGFEVDAESSYRDGDPCPKCGAWLTTVSE